MSHHTTLPVYEMHEGEEISSTSSSGVEVVDQPGGAVAAINGELINPLSVQEAALSSLNTIGAGMPWIAPLVEAAALSTKRDGARLLNAWGDGERFSDADRYGG